MEPFEYQGQWWLPGDSDNVTYGTLKFQPIEDARLELISSRRTSTNLMGRSNHTIILGWTREGLNITLYGCDVLEEKLGGGPVITKTFGVYVVLVGALVDKEDDLQFPHLNLNYSYLEDWAESPGFENEYTEDLKRFAIRYQRPDTLTAELKDLSISITHRVNMSPGKFKEGHIRHRVFVKIEPHQPVHLRDYLSTLCYHLQNFLSLGMGVTTQPLQIESTIQDEEGDNLSVQIFYRQPEPPGSGKTYRWPDALFTFADIQDQLAMYLGNWYASAERLKPVYDLYFALAYRPVVYWEHQFLNLIQAIEVYHRHWHIGAFMTRAERKLYCKMLKEALPPETPDGIKSHIYNALAFVHEYTLQERLLEIFKETGDSGYGDILKLLIPDPDRFTQDVKHTRNFLTHYTPGIARKAKTSDEELHQMVAEMKFMLEVFFLCVLGMPREVVKTLILRTNKYAYLKHIHGR